MQRPKLEQVIKIGARGSPLSLAQTRQLRARLAKSLGIDDAAIEDRLPIVVITTTGDRIQDRPLLEAGGKGLFTKELDEALLDGRIDCAVHSLKDVPTSLPDGICLLAGPEREDRRDALISLAGGDLDSLRHGAMIGTASLRRAAQLLYARPDLQIVSLRGNVGTRLEKLRTQNMDATLLAAAGLARLGLTDVPSFMLDPISMPPAIGQGALAITARHDDLAIQDAFAAICDPITHLETTAERAFLTALDGSCRTAIGAYTQCDDMGGLKLIGEALSGDGQRRWRVEGFVQNATLEASAGLGRDLGLQIKQMAGDALGNSS
jgi:hydroxymethylbilane synthase